MYKIIDKINMGSLGSLGGSMGGIHGSLGGTDGTLGPMGPWHRWDLGLKDPRYFLRVVLSIPGVNKGTGSALQVKPRGNTSQPD